MNLDQLEQIVDRIGLKNTVELLAILTEEKAEHIQTNWQDKNLAAAWLRSGRVLDKITHAIEV
jgi:hypothetical protein